MKPSIYSVKKKSDVHSIDVAAEMNYSKPSVSRAVNLLKDNDYLNIDNSGRITLTDAGDRDRKSVV